MPTSKLVLADAPFIKAMYDAEIPNIQAFWPGPVGSYPLATWQDWITTMGGWKETLANGTRRSFILTPRRPEPLTGLDAEEMFIWIAPTSLSNAAYAATTKALFTAWWTDLLNRGIPRGWGRNAPLYPNRTEMWFQNAITQGGMTVTVVPDAAGIQWRIVVMTPASALAGLGNLP